VLSILRANEELLKQERKRREELEAMLLDKKLDRGRRSLRPPGSRGSEEPSLTTGRGQRLVNRVRL